MICSQIVLKLLFVRLALLSFYNLGTKSTSMIAQHVQPTNDCFSKSNSPSAKFFGMNPIDPHWDTKKPCWIMCTTPKDECCLHGSDVSSSHRCDLIIATTEGLMHHIMNMHKSSVSNHPWLATCAWASLGHIGNRPEQTTFYYDWIWSVSKDVEVNHLCEIGMNGGHSAIIFLAALIMSFSSSAQGNTAWHGCQLDHVWFGKFQSFSNCWRLYWDAVSRKIYIIQRRLKRECK